MPLDHATEQSLGIDGTYACALNLEGIESLFQLVKPVDLNLEKWMKSHQTVTAIDMDTLLLRSLNLPILKDHAIDSSLPLQLESILPYPIEEALIDRITIQKNGKETFLNALAIKKESLKKHLQETQALGIDPEVVSIAPLALTLFTHFIQKTETPLFTLFFGEKILLIASKGKTLLASFATNDPKEIKKGLLSLRKKFPEAYQEAIFTIAPNPHDPRLVILQKEGLPLDPYSDEEKAPYAIAIGLALSCQPDNPGINFRKGEFAYKYPFKRLKKSFALYFGSIFFICISFYIFGSSYLAYQQDQIKESFREALDQRVDEELDVSNLSLDELREEILKWQKRVQATPNLFALHPNIPRVSDVLAWLTTHPTVENKLELLNFNYTMVKRPEPSRKDEKYQAKVELEFTTDTPRLAREFHDTLIAPNDFVDPKGEIKWSTSRGAYKASFYLKDRTAYP